MDGHSWQSYFVIPFGVSVYMGWESTDNSRIELISTTCWWYDRNWISRVWVDEQPSMEPFLYIFDDIFEMAGVLRKTIDDSPEGRCRQGLVEMMDRYVREHSDVHGSYRLL